MVLILAILTCKNVTVLFDYKLGVFKRLTQNKISHIYTSIKSISQDNPSWFYCDGWTIGKTQDNLF